MVRAPSYDRNGMKKGAWSEEEDNKLRSYVLRYGHWNWRLLPKYAGLARCGKSCRLRWVNYLKPGVKKGNFTKQEEDLIVELHAQLGQKWSSIAAKLPGRTDNDIKNFWHTRILQKRPKRNPTAKIITSPNTTDQLASPKHHCDQVITFCNETGNESASSDNACSSSAISFDADLWADIFKEVDNTDYTKNDYFPPLHCTELSSSESSYDDLSALQWVADDENNIMCSDYFSYLADQTVEGNFPSETFASNFPFDNIPPQEAGGLYDDFIYYDYGMNLFS